MKRIIIYLFVFICLGLQMGRAQSSLSNFELRFENGVLATSTTYSFDVYLYNTGTDTFELRAGTVSFWINPSWRNGGTITPSVSSSGLVTAQQTGTSAYTNGSTDFFRRTIASVAAGAGTSVPNGSKVKLFTFLFTNTASFSTSATPNFAFKFSGGNPAGFTFTDTTTTASAIAVNSTTVTATQTNCYTPAYWTGSQWNSGSTTASSASTSAPTNTKDAVIYTGSFSGALTCRSYYLASGATHTLGASTLNVAYNFTNAGTFSGASGTLNLNGTMITQTSNQTLSGTSISVNNLGFGTAANGGMKTLSTGVSVAGTVTQSGTAVLASGGNLTLLSTASGTANVAVLNSGNDITGNITVERYLPASYRRYRFLSSPVIGGTTLQWRDNGATNSGRGIQITNSTGTVDPSTSNMPSAFKYTESLSTGGSNINSKWEAIDGNTALNSGQGYRVFVRGDRTRSLTSTSDTTPNNTTIWVSGTYPMSPVSMFVTYNPSYGDGWNLVGNPFPSPIDWNAASGWTKTNISGTIYIWNPITNSFGSYDGVTGVNSVTRYIASGQAFFVHATGASPALSVSEAAKVSNTPSNMFKGSEINTLRMILFKDTTEKDEAVIRFMDNKKDAFDPSEDVVKFPNPGLNIGTFVSANLYAMVNYLDVKSLPNTTVPLEVKVPAAGIYTIQFNQLADFDPGIYVYLKDTYKNTTTNLRTNGTYTFEADGNSQSTADGRLQLIFSNKANALTEQGNEQAMQLNVYPVPAKETLYLSWNLQGNDIYEISIMDLNGALVKTMKVNGNTCSIDVSDLSNGVYMIQFTNIVNGSSISKKFVH